MIGLKLASKFKYSPAPRRSFSVELPTPWTSLVRQILRGQHVPQCHRSWPDIMRLQGWHCRCESNRAMHRSTRANRHSELKTRIQRRHHCFSSSTMWAGQRCVAGCVTVRHGSWPGSHLCSLHARSRSDSGPHVRLQVLVRVGTRFDASGNILGGKEGEGDGLASCTFLADHNLPIKTKFIR